MNRYLILYMLTGIFLPAATSADAMVNNNGSKTFKDMNITRDFFDPRDSYSSNTDEDPADGIRILFRILILIHWKMKNKFIN